MNIIKKKIKKYGIYLLIIMGLIYFIIEPKYGFISLYHAYRKRIETENNIKEIKARIILLQNKVYKLKYNKEYIEKQLREKMGMAKKNEKIIIKK